VWPDGWQGRRFTSPVMVWTGSPTNETSRDIVQTELIGGVGQEYGTGLVPRRKLIGAPLMRQAGVRGVADSFHVQHASGGVSVCMMKTYEQGWQKWQGRAPHVVWLDEEPDDYMIFSEAQTRILTVNGIIMVTFTPLSGVTELVQHFQDGGDGIYLKGATWEDAPHLAGGDRERLARSYRAHERDARTKGVPMLGEGAVFPVSDDTIRVPPFKVPDHFARIKGCDFGIDHPAAGVELAWDRDQDVVYVIDCYRQSDKTAVYHAAWFTKATAACRWPGRTTAWRARSRAAGRSPIPTASTASTCCRSRRATRAPGRDGREGGGAADRADGQRDAGADDHRPAQGVLQLLAVAGGEAVLSPQGRPDRGPSRRHPESHDVCADDEALRRAARRVQVGVIRRRRQVPIATARVCMFRWRITRQLRTGPILCSPTR
jgi:phage terminase large subunit-like protein